MIHKVLCKKSSGLLHKDFYSSKSLQPKIMVHHLCDSIFFLLEYKISQNVPSFSLLINSSNG